MVNHRSPKPELQVRFLPLLPKIKVKIKVMVNIFKRVPVFIGEVKAELAKVSWTSRKELWGATGIVMVATAILTAYIGVLDFVLSKAVSLVLK